MEWTTDDLAMHSKIFEATDENDLEVAMVLLRGGTHIEEDEEERSARAGIYRGMRDAR